ncbi:PAS domain-containing sensor histidine kinase [Algibacter sp. L4_22]|uniref:PAS domain-containing sensor histidine kinase n=1 Tax=Algibacter sp. L4_22 TaxID=2942477 RepID=UPI00201B8375|nr:PAS domain-containing sensor histidine kinase [Algibacter sp. L4_22]MCL5129398.1 PAS domain-containing sensor histidine kinase [Algibacter sp. L4_22]
MDPHLDPFFELSMDCLCIANYEGYFLKINPAFVELLGYSEAELNSKLISDFIYEEDKERTASNRNNLKNNKPLINFENRYVSKSGKIIWLHWTAIPVEKDKLVYAIAKDITHKKELENERISHLSKLSEANDKLKQLNYTTSHDLRSPVNNLISLVDLLDLSKIEDQETLKILSYIKISAEGLNTSLNAYVEAFKQKNILDEKLELIHFNTIFLKVQNSISALIQKSGAEFQLDFSNLERVHFNTAYMESVFLNFITNSIKYSRPDVPLVISIISDKKNGKSIFKYSDNGLGFNMEKVGHLIFKLNQRFHGNEDSKGVGLYLVYNHVTNLGGSINVDSAVNQGTTFTISFNA